MTRLAWLIYVPLQILWLPFSVLGGLFAYKTPGASRNLLCWALGLVRWRRGARLYIVQEDQPCCE